MSRKFDLLKQQLKQVDKQKAGQLIKEVKEAYKDGQIDKTEREELLNTAKLAFGSLFKNFGGFGKK